MKKIEISLCSICGGKGVKCNSELSDYHKGEYRYWSETCSHCEGHGRVEVTTETTITIKPYKTPEPEESKD